MRLGIVGHAAEKFTPGTMASAKVTIQDAIIRHGATTIVSGHSPMGGVDIWAEEAATELNLWQMIFPARVARWEGDGGFRERNLKIARHSDLVLVVVVQELPPGYKGMRFKGCYHCRDRNPPHVKSGACWTAWKAPAREWAIICWP